MLVSDNTELAVVGSETLATTIEIQNLIYVIRGKQVMLDSDLAQLYQVETKVFNQAVKRHIERFPESFRFQLTENEFESLRSQLFMTGFCCWMIGRGIISVRLSRMPGKNALESTESKMLVLSAIFYRERN